MVMKPTYFFIETGLGGNKANERSNDSGFDSRRAYDYNRHNSTYTFGDYMKPIARSSKQKERLREIISRGFAVTREDLKGSKSFRALATKCRNLRGST